MSCCLLCQHLLLRLRDKYSLSPIVHNLIALIWTIFWSSSSNTSWVMSVSREVWTRSNTSFLPHSLLLLFSVDILAIINISLSLSSKSLGALFKFILKTLKQSSLIFNRFLILFNFSMRKSPVLTQNSVIFTFLQFWFKWKS